MKWLKVITCKDSVIVNLKWVKSIRWNGAFELNIVYYNGDEKTLVFEEMISAKEAFEDIQQELDNYSEFIEV